MTLSGARSGLTLMEYHGYIDTHVHTDNSPDGHFSATHLCEKALEKGLRAVAFTDHCEVDVFYGEGYDRRVRQAYFEVMKAREVFTGDLLVLEGIELAQPAYEPETAKKIVDAFPYDYVIGSIHNLRNKDDFYYMPTFEGLDIDALMREYLNEEKIMCEWGGFDSLAHLTYPLRYFFARSQIIVEMDRYKKEVDEILALLIEKDKALEINSAGLRQPLCKLSPERDIIKRYRDMGGKLITLGSDAHFDRDLGAGLDVAAEAAYECGFRSSVIYQNRQPVEIPLYSSEA